jgi:hypothetical protein
MSSGRITLPALDGRDPLGFLAALGTTRLLAEEQPEPVRLSFDDTTALAVLHSPHRDIDHIATTLADIVHRIAEDGVVPYATAGFPRAKSGTGADPMRVPPDQLRQLRDAQPDPTDRRWLSVLLTDLATDNARRVALTPYCAPSGQQSLRSFFDKPLAAVRRHPQHLHEALTAWRRADTFTGEYLDHRVLRSAADHPHGKSTEAGVPGATWLAIMALPLLRLTGNGTNPTATLWHHVPGRREPLMAWPLWRQPLDPSAIQTLIEHPALKPKRDHNGVYVDAQAAQPLGVFAAAGAERQRITGRNFAGVLAPIAIGLRPNRTGTRPPR